MNHHVPHLQTRVILDNVVRRSVGVPVSALLVDLRGILQCSDLALALHHLHGEALIGVPRNVAVHDPGARVVGVPGKRSPAVGRQHSDVATRGVDQRQIGRCFVVGAGAGAENPEVVAVEVDRVCLAKVGVDDHEHPLVGVGEGPDVLGAVKGRVTVGDGLDSRVVPLGDEGDGVHSPLDLGTEAERGSLIVLLSSHTDVDGKVGNKVGGVFVKAGVLEVVGGGGGVLSGSGVVADNSEDVVNVVIVRAGFLGDRTQPEVTSGLGSGDDNIITLAHTNANGSGVVRDNGDEVAGDDLKRVVVDGEAEVRVGCAVHETEAVALSGDEVGLKARADDGAVIQSVGVGTVDQAVLAGGRAAGGGSQGELIGSGERPVVHKDMSEILVVVGSSRAVDENAAEDTVPSLNREVRVVPR